MLRSHTGASSSGKTQGFDPCIQRFESSRPSHGITGPNGGGKTTLAKTIMGINKTTRGKIIYNGKEITDMTITDRARQGIAYGFQQSAGSRG